MEDKWLEEVDLNDFTGDENFEGEEIVFRSIDELRASMTEEQKKNSDAMFEKFYGPYRTHLPIYLGAEFSELNDLIHNIYDGKYKERYMGARKEKTS